MFFDVVIGMDLLIRIALNTNFFFNLPPHGLERSFSAFDPAARNGPVFSPRVRIPDHKNFVVKENDAFDSLCFWPDKKPIQPPERINYLIENPFHFYRVFFST